MQINVNPIDRFGFLWIVVSVFSIHFAVLNCNKVFSTFFALSDPMKFCLITLKSFKDITVSVTKLQNYLIGRFVAFICAKINSFCKK